MRLRSMWVSALGLTLAASVVACGGGSKETAAPAETAAAAGGGQKVDPATAGDVNGVVAFDGTAPKNEPIKMNADPVCVKANTTPQEQETYVVTDGKLANVFVYVKDGLEHLLVRPADRDAHDRPEELPLSSARVRRPRRPGRRDRQQRSDAPQHPRAAEGQRGVQQRPADPGHEDDAHVHGQGSHGAVQVRRARLDERLRRRGRQPVLRGHRQGRQVLAQGPAAGHLHASKRGTRSSARRRRPSRSARRKPRTRTSRSRPPPRPRTSSQGRSGGLGRQAAHARPARPPARSCLTRQ